MKKILALTLAFMLTFGFVACGDKDDDTDSDKSSKKTTAQKTEKDSKATTKKSSAKTTKKSDSGDDNENDNNDNQNPDGIIDISKQDITLSGVSATKNEVLDEIPAEIMKGVGECDFAVISNLDVIEGYKYSLLINLNTEAGKGYEELEKLVEYYRSVGAEVTDAEDFMNDFVVKFDYAESAICFAMDSYIQLQFGVLKEEDSDENPEDPENEEEMTLSNWEEVAERWLDIGIDVPEGWTAVDVDPALQPQTGTVTFEVTGDTTPEQFAETIFRITRNAAVKQPYKFTMIEDDVITKFEDAKLSTANDEKSAGWYYGLNDSWTGIRCIKFTYTDTTCSWYIA